MYRSTAVPMSELSQQPGLGTGQIYRPPFPTAGSPHNRDDSSIPLKSSTGSESLFSERYASQHRASGEAAVFSDDD